MSVSPLGQNADTHQDLDSENPSGYRNLSVNAAFLKDIKDDNRELKSLLDRLTPMTGHPEIASNHWSEITQLLSDLRDQLALHFSLEEAYGYFDEAVQAEPQLSLTAGALRSEHTDLFETVCSLADQVSDVQRPEPEPIKRFLNKLRKFRNRFEQHEEAELQLILDAMSEDLGVGD
jgi:iron-sulfur cluster repair protein YtfE (RIC family)